MHIISALGTFVFTVQFLGNVCIQLNILLIVITFRKRHKMQDPNNLKRGGGALPPPEKQKNKKKNHVFGVSNLEFMNIL